jgi:hypothetical protein
MQPAVYQGTKSPKQARSRGPSSSARAFHRVSSSLLGGIAIAKAENRSELPSNRTTGAMLLTALALSDDNLLVALREPQVLRRVDVSLHSCLGHAVQDKTWLSVWQAVHDLQQVLVSLVPMEPFVMEPTTNEAVLHIWREIDTRMSLLKALVE